MLIGHGLRDGGGVRVEAVDGYDLLKKWMDGCMNMRN